MFLFELVCVMQAYMSWFICSSIWELEIIDFIGHGVVMGLLGMGAF
jgi:hypothetical protein